MEQSSTDFAVCMQLLGEEIAISEAAGAEAVGAYRQQLARSRAEAETELELQEQLFHMQLSAAEGRAAESDTVSAASHTPLACRCHAPKCRVACALRHATQATGAVRHTRHTHHARHTRHTPSHRRACASLRPSVRTPSTHP